MRRHRSGRVGSLAGSAVALVLGVVVALGLAELAARLIQPHWQEYDSEPWLRQVWVAGIGRTTTGVSGYDGRFAQSDGDFRVHIRINAQGLRNDPGAVADGALWMVGDSFTFGWGVERDQVFGAVAAHDLGLPSYSVASPGTDVRGYRALLSLMPAEIKPKAVLLGLCMENDIADYRHATDVPPAADAPQPLLGRVALPVVKQWLLGHSAFYVMVAVTLKHSAVAVAALTKLGVIAAPMAQGWEVARHSDVEIQSTAQEIDALRRMLPPGTPFATVVVPARFDIEAPGSDWTKDREAMVAAMRALGLTVVDPGPELIAAGLKTAHFAHDGHWSVAGHRIAGDKAALILAQAFPQLKDAP